MNFGKGDVSVVSSPCVRKCRLVEGKCSGCGRTLEHIKHWLKYTEEERKEIVTQIQDRG